MLERLAEQAMAIAGRLTARAVAPEIGDEVADVAEVFAKVSRAVRLTLILEAKLDEQILAYRNGDFTALDEPKTRSGPRGVRDPGPARDAADRANVRERDGDTEGAEFDRLPTGGFKACVAEICDDLGLDPDWSCWSDEEGFIRDDGKPVTDWPTRRDPPSALASSGDDNETSRRMGRLSSPTQPKSGEDRLSSPTQPRSGEDRLSSPTQPRSGEDRGRHEAPRGRPDG